jgi:hypothetical protein
VFFFTLKLQTANCKLQTAISAPINFLVELEQRTLR